MHKFMTSATLAEAVIRDIRRLRLFQGFLRAYLIFFRWKFNMLEEAAAGGFLKMLASLFLHSKRRICLAENNSN